MPVKKEPSGRRSVQVEVEVPGTPEEVWRAIGTGAGISSWFVPTKLDERVGGKLTCTFAPGMESSATITAWNPPHYSAAEGPLGPNAPTLATEWFVEARSGGTCIVRVVHSLFASTDDWDKQLEDSESGWPAFFHTLRLVLTHFRGQQFAAIHELSMPPGPQSQLWESSPARLASLAQPLDKNAALPPLCRLSPAPSSASARANTRTR